MRGKEGIQGASSKTKKVKDKSIALLKVNNRKFLGGKEVREITTLPVPTGVISGSNTKTSTSTALK